MEFLHSKELEEFYENYDKLHPGEVSARCRNIYDIKAVDMDGNVVEQKFALNLMTDAGFQSAYKYGYWSFENSYRRIWIGEGTEYPKYNNKALYGRFTTSEPQGSVGRYDADSTNCDGMRFDKSTNTCSITRKGQYGYYDYNISDLNGNTITENKYIREIGIGQSWDNLTMHAKVYDKNGEESSITKKPNQRLYITTYVTTTMDPSFITEHYDNGVYVVTDLRFATKICANETNTDTRDTCIGYTPNHSKFRYTLADSGAGNFPFYGGYYSDGSWNVYNEADHTIKYIGNSGGGGLMEDKHDYISEEEVMAGCGWIGNNLRDNQRAYYGNIINFRYVNCEEPDELENVTVFTDSRTSGLFKKSFGSNYEGDATQGRIPATDGDIHKVSMYNHYTKEWDIEEEFVNNPELQLYDYWMARYCRVWMYITFLNSNKTAYVFVNTHTDRPIYSFAQSGFTLYATDTYWDTDSWETIGNIKSVPEELRCKRYYISLTDPESWTNMGDDAYAYGSYHNGRSLIPDRNDDIYHEVIPVSPCKTYTLPYTAPYESSRVVSNNELGYIAYANCLFYPDAINPETNLPYAYRLTDESGSNIDDEYIFGFGRKIIVLGDTQGRSGKSYYVQSNEVGTNKYTYPDDRINPTEYQRTYYYPIAFGGDAIGFRVYTIGDTPGVEPTYEDFKFPSIRYNPNGWSSQSPESGGNSAYNIDGSYFIKYEQGTPTTSSHGFLVLSSLHPKIQGAYPFPTIINLHGGEDGESVEIQELKDYYMGMAIDESDYVCVWMKDNSVPYKYGIYNVKTKEIEKEFEFESGYTVMGYAGWKNYVYFLTTFNSERRSFVYHIDTEVLEYCPNETFWFLNNLQNVASGTSQDVHYDEFRYNYSSYSGGKYAINSVSNDEVVIFSISAPEGNWGSVPTYYREYGQCFFTAENPTHRRFVTESDKSNPDGFTVYRHHGDIKYINSEDKQLIYVATSQNRLIIQDMGLRIDNPTDVDSSFYPTRDMGWYDNYKAPSIGIFKDRIFLIKPNTGVVQELPIEYCIRHKLEMSTHTITAYNNPVRISASTGFTATVTNRVDPKGE